MVTGKLTGEMAELVFEEADPREGDAAALIERLTAELAERYDFLDDGTGNFRPEDVSGHGAAFLVGRVNGVAIACGALKPMLPGVGELKRIFVTPEYRGNGVGRKLLKALEERGKNFGYSTLRLETGVRQPESLRLYEAAGFQRIPNFEPHVGSEWSVCYEKVISE